MDKLIISACICGAEVTKENNPAVPYTVEEVVREAKSAYDAGAALIHLHVRWDDGTPTQDKGRFQEMVDAIRKECPDVIIQPSTGGAVGMTDLERLQSTEITPTPEMATLDCGTCNFGGDEIFINTDNTIANFGDIMQERGIKPECEVFDKGMIDLALKAAKKGHIKYPIHFDFVLFVTLSSWRHLFRQTLHGQLPVSARTHGASLLRPSLWADTFVLVSRITYTCPRAFWQNPTAKW